MIYLTPDAIKEFNRLGKYRHQDLSQTFLRVGVQPGSCSDFSYALTFDETVNANTDMVIDTEGFNVVINHQDTDALNGLTIDYSEDLMGGAFRFLNPNATYTCDCGNSFSLDSVETESSEPE